MTTAQHLTNLLKWKWPSLGGIDADDLGFLNALVASDTTFINRFEEFIRALQSNTPPNAIDFSDDVFTLNFGDRIYLHIFPNPNSNHPRCPPFLLQVYESSAWNDYELYEHQDPKVVADALIAVL